MVDALLAGRWLLALVLLCAGLAKLGDRERFAEAVRRYSVIPDGAAPAVAAGLPVAEVVVALAPAAGIAPVVTGSCASVLLLGFAGAIGVNLARAERFECGCGGVAGRQIGWTLLGRNLALGVIGAAVAVGPAGLALLPRPIVAGRAHVAATGLVPIPLTVIALFVLIRCVQSVGSVRAGRVFQWGDRG